MAGPFLTRGLLPTSSVALPVPLGFPVPLTGHPLHLCWPPGHLAGLAFSHCTRPAVGPPFPLLPRGLAALEERGHLWSRAVAPPALRPTPRADRPLLPWLSSMPEDLAEPSHSLTLQPSVAPIVCRRKAKLLMRCFVTSPASPGNLVKFRWGLSITDQLCDAHTRGN